MGGLAGFFGIKADESELVLMDMATAHPLPMAKVEFVHPMTLDRAISVLNTNKFLGLEWEFDCRHSNGVDHVAGRFPLGHERWTPYASRIYEAFTIVAIAEHIERFGVDFRGIQLSRPSRTVNASDGELLVIGGKRA